MTTDLLLILECTDHSPLSLDIEKKNPLPTGPPPIFIRDLQDEAIKIGDPLLLSCQ
ncbi:hypothetical protein NQ314_005689, partial [Rhamnusium bicolor]